MGGRHVGCGISLKLNGMTFGEAGCKGMSYQTIQPVTYTAKFGVPNGNKGRSLELKVTMNAGGGNGNVAYIYKWAEGAVGSTSSTAATPGSSAGSDANSTPGSGVGATASKPGEPGFTEPAATDRTPIQVAKRSVLSVAKVVVPVWLVKGSQLGSLSFNVTYDTAVAQAVAPVTKGNLLERASFQANPNERATVRVATAASGDFGGPNTGTVALLTFQAKGKPGSRTTLHVDVTAASGTSPQSIAKIDGELAVIGQTAVVPGDSDKNGKLTARDANQALKMDVRTLPENRVLDVDNSDKVDSTDARLILRKVVEK